MGHLSAQDFRDILGKCEARPRIYIETGLWKGDQLAIAAPFFEICHGIELDQYWHSTAKRRVAAHAHVQVHHGDTRQILPQLLEQYDEPCFVKLDAHYCSLSPAIQKSPFPLWEELELLRDRHHADVVSVDDTHTFGVKRPELRFKPDEAEWENVTEKSIQAFLGERSGPGREISGGYVIWLRSM